MGQGVQAHLRDPCLAAFTAAETPGLQPPQGLIDLPQGGLVTGEKIETELLGIAVRPQVGSVVSRRPNATVPGKCVVFEFSDIREQFPANVAEEGAVTVQVLWIELASHGKDKDVGAPSGPCSEGEREHRGDSGSAQPGPAEEKGHHGGTYMAATDPFPAPLDPAWTDEVEDFLEALRVEAGLARNTLAAYRRDLVRFARWGTERGLAGFDRLDSADVIAYLNEGRSAGLAESSLARGLSALRMCVRHQVAEGRLKRDPLARIPAPKLRRALPATLTVEDVDALLAAPGLDDWHAQRDTALLEVLYASGARIAEAVGLRTDGIEPSLRVLKLTGKGNKTRLVPLGARARKALTGWLEGGRRTRKGYERAHEVFLSKNGRALDRTSAWRIVKRAAQRAGLDPTISPHTLRHSFASHLVEGGADLRSVQEMLGHASIRTTEIYTHMDAEHILSLHRMYHPRG